MSEEKKYSNQVNFQTFLLFSIDGIKGFKNASLHVKLITLQKQKH